MINLEATVSLLIQIESTLLLLLVGSHLTQKPRNLLPNFIFDICTLWITGRKR